MPKEFADVINWLRSEEGEGWSHDNCRGSVYYGTSEYRCVPGFFSLKPDDIEGAGYHGPMWWGDLPGDDRLAAEANA